MEKEIIKPKTRQQKILMAIPYFLLWLLYFALTVEARNRFMMAESKGYHCYDSKETGWLPGSEQTYYFDRTKPPQRDYITWKEFWKGKGY